MSTRPWPSGFIDGIHNINQRVVHQGEEPVVPGVMSVSVSSVQNAHRRAEGLLFIDFDHPGNFVCVEAHQE